MLSSAIVVFREVFEIVLIVGIILAATRGIPRRTLAIALGFGMGVGGSALVAIFTDSISSFAEGIGQEIFNAAILFTAAGFIGWTVLWMKKHARELKSHFSNVGQAVADGRLPYFSLSLVIGLAMLREGSEIVLFSYGMLASGMSFMTLASGAALGLVGGLAVGSLLYFGLIKLSVRYFFVITSWLLVLLVAGMALQGTGFLVAAGLFDSLSQQLWDTSWLLEERGLIGQSLGTLVGYTARPTAIQIIVYILTLGTLIMLMRLSTPGKNAIKAGGATAAILLLSFMLPGQAHATKTVSSPYVHAGELEVEYKAGYDIDDDNDVDGGWKQKAAVGYGVNSFWYTELEGEIEKEGESGADPEFTAIGWENKFQLTEPGAYWLDAGVKFEYERNLVGDADKGEMKILLAKKTDDFSHKANLILEREFGEDSSDETEYGAAWSTAYRYMPEFEPGVEIYSEFGEWGEGEDFNDQKHMMGPVAYGKLGFFKYDVGVLFGVTDAAPDATLKAIFEYEWYF